jgi:hypothetical protein
MHSKVHDKETFQIILSSRGNNVTNLGALNAGIPENINTLKYYCNWPAMLPIEKYTKYSCSFVFKSENYAGILTNNGFVNVDVGRTQIFDGTTQSFNLGIIYPVALNVTAGSQSSFYNSTNNDNNSVIIYPTQNIVTVTLNTFAGAAMANLPNYCLILNLSPCI